MYFTLQVYQKFIGGEIKCTLLMMMHECDMYYEQEGKGNDARCLSICIMQKKKDGWDISACLYDSARVAPVFGHW